MAAKGVGILEASPVALAIVILFFLVFTLGFEHLLHWARHALIRRKKFGLLAALNNFASEIMLLGVASLLLMAFEDTIAKRCVAIDTSPSLQPWLTKVNGCACCLQKTRGVSECFFQSKQCPAADVREAVCTEQGALKGLHHKSLFATVPANATKPAGNATKPAGNATTAAGNSTKAAGNATSPAPKAPAARRPAASAQQFPAQAAAAAAGRYVAPAGPAPAAAVGGESPQGRRRLLAPAAEEEEEGDAKTCMGAYEAKYAQCNNRPGYMPVVTVATLHQVHMLLFIMASTHIIVSVVVLLISATKLKFYARRGGSPFEDALAASALRLAAARADADAKRAGGGGFAPSKSVTDAASPADAPRRAPAALQGAGGAAAGAAPRDSGASGRDSEPDSVFAVVGAVPPALAGGGDSGAHAAAAAAAEEQQLVAEPWNGRPARMSGVKDFLIEALVFVVRQVALLNTVSRQEYAVLRATFYLTHAPALSRPAPSDGGHGGGGHADAAAHLSGAAHRHGHHQPSLRPDQAGGSYAPYVLESVERDGSRVVGLGLPMWLLVLVFVLVSGVTGWAAWWFLILAGALLLFVNTVLLASLRHMTRGGRVMVQQPAWYQWLHRSAFLLGSIKLTLFFFTFVISNTVYFAGWFGPESCFFSRTGFQKNPVPWWAILLIDLCLLLNLALFTLPMYSLTTHTLKVDAALFQSVVADKVEEQEVARLRAAQGSAAAKGHGHGAAKGGHGSHTKFEELQMAQSV